MGWAPHEDAFGGTSPRLCRGSRQRERRGHVEWARRRKSDGHNDRSGPWWRLKAENNGGAARSLEDELLDGPTVRVAVLGRWRREVRAALSIRPTCGFRGSRGDGGGGVGPRDLALCSRRRCNSAVHVQHDGHHENPAQKQPTYHARLPRRRRRRALGDGAVGTAQPTAAIAARGNSGGSLPTSCCQRHIAFLVPGNLQGTGPWRQRVRRWLSFPLHHDGRQPGSRPVYPVLKGAH
jgi:hypothetical protein